MWRQLTLKYQQAVVITSLDFYAWGIELAILQSLVHFYNHQTANTLNPIFPSMLFSLWSCITLVHVLKVQFQFTRLCERSADTNRRPFSGLPISTESNKVRDGGGKVDKSGCSSSWREKWFGRKWVVGAGTKAQFRSCSVNLETSS